MVHGHVNFGYDLSSWDYNFGGHLVSSMITADGFDGCLIGKDSKDRAIYDADAMIEVLMIRDEMGYEEAVEYFWFNIDGSYMGEDTPIYVFLNYDR